jgi:glycosyltransferase involved in cell wall biosynthesis
VISDSRMHVLFVHQAYPSQFGPIAEWMSRTKEHRVTFVSTDPSRWHGAIENIQHAFPPDPKAGQLVPWMRDFPRKLQRCRGVVKALKKRPDVRPDLVVGHSGFGSTLFIREVLDCPIVNYFEYFNDSQQNDMLYRIDFDHSDEYRCWRRSANAIFLLDLENCDVGYSPTRWQRSLLPESYRSKVKVIFDGVDTKTFRPLPKVPRVIRKTALPRDVRIVTYVARGFELIRGFDIFMKVAKRIYTEYPNVLFLVAGRDRVEYGTDVKLIGLNSFKRWVLEKDTYDLSKFRFPGWLSTPELVRLFNLSDLHIYLTTPFPPSWSLFKALACGATVLASNTPPVREVIKDGTNGLLAGFFDVDGLAKQAIDVLRAPSVYRDLRATAVSGIQNNYSNEVVLPKLLRFFEQAATHRHSGVADDLVRYDGSMPEIQGLS